MIYLYKDPKGIKLFEKTSSQFNSQVNAALSSTPNQQQLQQDTIALSTLPSSVDREKEELKETIHSMEKAIREKDKTITEQQNGSSSVNFTIWDYKAFYLCPNLITIVLSIVFMWQITYQISFYGGMDF